MASSARRALTSRSQRFALRDLLQGTPAEPWLREISAHESGPYYYSHVTDVLRLALLFRDGGVYLDTDVVLARPLRLAHVASTVARRGADLLAGADAPPVLRSGAIGIESYGRVPLELDGRADAAERVRERMVMGGGAPVLNGAVLYFERGSRFLWTALDELPPRTAATSGAGTGPSCSCASRRAATAADATVQLEPPATFYPMHWAEAPIYTRPGQPDAQKRLWSTIERRSYAVHLWNRKTAGAEPAAGSVVERGLLSSWRVLPPITVLPNYPGTVAGGGAGVGADRGGGAEERSPFRRGPGGCASACARSTTTTGHR